MHLSKVSYIYKIVTRGEIRGSHPYTCVKYGCVDHHSNLSQTIRSELLRLHLHFHRHLLRFGNGSATRATSTLLAGHPLLYERLELSSEVRHMKRRFPNDRGPLVFRSSAIPTQPIFIRKGGDRRMSHMLAYSQKETSSTYRWQTWAAPSLSQFRLCWRSAQDCAGYYLKRIIRVT